ncbi:MAG TPA: HD domain-containing protein [Bacteroidia bacterium]
MSKSKIINDPVYGFLTVPGKLIRELIEHPYVQRLRRIKQLGMSEFVYPGATHSRFHHALGALHLMMQAVSTLRQKDIKITDKEAEALYCGILLHDLGHGPYSHSLEHTLIKNVAHEKVSLMMMHKINEEFDSQLDLCIQIFTNKYRKKFLHQLISGQLDMDRLDYLGRDSFYTGVSEGIIGSERIINMLNVVNDELVVEEKGIYSVEKFIIARRLMYWQVYLHKTVVAADLLLTNTMKRAAELARNGVKLNASPTLAFFLENEVSYTQFKEDPNVLENFIRLDDSDIFSAIKSWQFENDAVLSKLASNLVNRRLPKMMVSTKQFSEKELKDMQNQVAKTHKIAKKDIGYFVSMAMIKNDAYKVEKSTSIRILMKTGEVIDVTDASDNYNLKALKETVKKYYLSFYR